jgi:CBS domain-containing protein
MADLRELMVTDTITVLPTDTVLEAVQRMTNNRVGAVLVVKDGELWGLISERDVMTRVIAQQRDPATTDAASVATREVVHVDAAAPLKEVLAIFRDKRFRHLPVTERGKPVGILSTRDFLSYLVDGLERFIDEQNYAQGIAAGTDPYDHLGGAYGK